jgi:mycothiol synthase
MPAATVAPAAPAERPAALGLAFGYLAPADRHARVAAGLGLIERGELDPAGVLLARAGRRAVGAMLAAPVPGSGAAVWPPQVEPGTPDAEAVADALVRYATDWLRARGTRLAQALLAPEDAPQAAPLVRNGFTHPTALWQLRHYLDLPAELLGAPERLTFEGYAAADPAEFAATLGRTYEGTLDCPEVNGVRSVDEAIAGHRAGGSDQDLWWLARHGGAPVGVLMANAVPEEDGWEVAYVGVVAAARRRGFGRELLGKALLEAKAAGQAHVALSVDARNAPARELYRRLGFESYDRREVFLATWPGG